MNYYLILENGFTQKEYNNIRNVNQGTMIDAITKARSYFRTVYTEKFDPFNRYCITGQNKQGFSATIAILEN